MKLKKNAKNEKCGVFFFCEGKVLVSVESMQEVKKKHLCMNCTRHLICLVTPLSSVQQSALLVFWQQSCMVTHQLRRPTSPDT